MLRCLFDAATSPESLATVKKSPIGAFPILYYSSCPSSKPTSIPLHILPPNFPMLMGHILLIDPCTATLFELVIQRTLRPRQCLQRCYNILKMMRITDNCKHKTTQLVRVKARPCKREGVLWSGSIRIRWGFSSWREGWYQEGNPGRVRAEADRNKDSQQDQRQT